MGRYASLIILALFISVLFLRIHTQGTVLDSVGNSVEKFDVAWARNIANSGATIALNGLTLNVEETEAVQNRSLYGGEFSYYYQRREEDPTLGPTEIRVTCTSRFHDSRDTVVVLLTRPSFSRYAYFTNYEGNIWFNSGDTLRGPVHTNTYFQMAGTPVFFDKVTSHQLYQSGQPYRIYPYGYTNPNFLGGTEWGVPYLSMPSSMPQELIDAAKDSGLYLPNRYVWMKFQSDGTALICGKNTYSTPDSWEYSSYNISNTNGVIFNDYPYETPYLFVEGTARGNYTVASEGRIVISDDILLADDPRYNPNSTDMVGLAATKDIIVYNNQYNTDRTILATCMAMNPYASTTSNFYVHNYDDYKYGTLHLFGGLIQRNRGAVGLVGDESTRKGYLKDYRWDSRLREMTPPYFPMLFVLKKIAWWD
ncbi:DUF4900 domain-containing protein [candidate division KSB1 bacterium]|nr:DUF4900 domain-containing protein [candidate division KSB1 bacterium]